MKRASIFVTSLLTILFVTPSLCGAEPHENWLKFMAGKWRIDAGRTSVALELEFVADGRALAGPANYGNDTSAHSLFGWEADEKKLVQTYYTSTGDYRRIEYTEVSDDVMNGVVVGSIGGRQLRAKVTLQKVDENSFSATYAEMTIGGTPQDAPTITVVRVE